MADTKITGLTENSTPADSDLIHMVDDPGGSPLNQKITITNLLGGVTQTEMGYVSGVTSDIQTQIDGKIGELSDDSTPQLGGPLDAQNEVITFEVEDNGTKTAGFTVDWNEGQKQKVTLNNAGPLAVTLTAPPEAGNFLLEIVQGATPGTLTWPGTVKWPGGTAPTLSTGTGDIDIVSFYYNGTNYYGQAALDFQ